MDETTVIVANDLRQSRNDFEMVTGLNFQLERGEFFGLIGPNGSVKTTAFRMLTGQMDPCGGPVRVAR